MSDSAMAAEACGRQPSSDKQQEDSESKFVCVLTSEVKTLRQRLVDAERRASR